jgi:hypothetical protein
MNLIWSQRELNPGAQGEKPASSSLINWTAYVDDDDDRIRQSVQTTSREKFWKKKLKVDIAYVKNTKKIMVI